MRTFIISVICSACVSATLLFGAVSFAKFSETAPIISRTIEKPSESCVEQDKYYLLKKWLPLYLAIFAILFIYLRETKDRKDKQQIAALSKKLAELQDEIGDEAPDLEDRKKSVQEYERSVCQHMRNRGYTVSYNGVKQGFDDEGIDLICTKAGETLLVQCKDWDESRFLHENYIFQLFGAAKYYEASEHVEAVPCLCCSCRVTNQARITARILGVKIMEEF